MSYLHLIQSKDFDLIQKWLQPNGELFVKLEFPHSGSSGSHECRIRSTDDFKSLISEIDWSEIEIFVYRDLLYPIRGIANNDLLRKAKDLVPTGRWYKIIKLDEFYPSWCSTYGSGSTHEELVTDFEEMSGFEIGIGTDPFDETNPITQAYLQEFRDTILYIGVHRNWNSGKLSTI